MVKRLEMHQVGTEECDGTSRRKAGPRAWSRLKESLAAGSVILAAGCGSASMQNLQAPVPVQTAIQARTVGDSKEGPEEIGSDGKTIQEYVRLVDAMRVLYNDPAVNAGLFVESMGRVSVLNALYLDVQSARTMLDLTRDGRYDLAVEVCDKSRDMTSSLLAWRRLQTYLTYLPQHWGP